jgi:hypothetical protein
VAQQFGVVVADGIGGDDFLFRDDEHVDRRLRRDVAKGEAFVVFIDDVGGDLAVDDSLEDGAHGLCAEWCDPFAGNLLKRSQIHRLVGQHHGDLVNNRVKQVAGRTNQPAVERLLKRFARHVL